MKKRITRLETNHHQRRRPPPLMKTTSYLLMIIPIFLSLTLLSHASSILDPSDHKAFIHIQKQLGLTGQKPCSNNGVLCEKTISTHTSILKITHLVFQSQHLKGSLSPFTGNLTHLTELTLSNNYLFGQLPSQIINCQELQILNLKNNRFSGQVPTHLSKLIRLRVLDLSSNQFTGDLSFLKHFPNLEILSLGDNLFTGKIPTPLKSFPSLKSFNISGNEHIYGPERVQYIPSHTETRSIVPRRYILSQNSSIHTAPAPSPKQHNHSHNGTAKAPAPSPKQHNHSHNGTAKAPSPSPSPAPSTSHKHQKHKKLKQTILGFLVGGIAGSIFGLLFSFLYRLIVVLARRSKPEGPAIFSPLIKRVEDLAFLENEDGLANMQIVGRGACGEVYKAELPGSNGKLIAIKKVIQPPREAASVSEEESKQLNSKMRQIRSEIQTVGKVRHRNLLALLAHMPRPECHLLVYEFMKNGSLQDILHQAAAGTRDLNWLARYKIALGVAVGLEHLHINTNPKIIHRDLKPANILLDDDMEPRIADFGLAKPIPEDNTHVTSSKWVGTFGYIAPEYHQTLKFTDKCDIYSYGVILGALVVGKFPSDVFFQNTPEMQLVMWMRNKMTSEDPRSAIDPNIRSDGYTEQILQVLKIACFCTREDPKERPGSKDIRCMLSQIKH